VPLTRRRGHRAVVPATRALDAPRSSLKCSVRNSSAA